MDVMAQNTNPFEINSRLEEEDTLSLDVPQLENTSPSSSNPFDITSTPSKPGLNSRQVKPKVTPKSSSKNSSAVFKFVLVIIILTILAFLLTILRSVAAKSFNAFLNSNMLNQLYREQEGRGISPFVLLYLMFLINLGIFLFLSLEVFGYSFSNNKILALLISLACSFGLFIGKHFLLSLVGFIFPVKKEISRYHFLIIIFGIIIGFLLVPFNLLLAFGPESTLEKIVYGFLFSVGLIYVYRYFKAMAIASKFLVFHKFHFLLYICTIEIAPVIIILKIAQGGI